MYCHAVDDGVSSVRGALLAPEEEALDAPAMSAETDAPIAPSIDAPADCDGSANSKMSRGASESKTL